MLKIYVDVYVVWYFCLNLTNGGTWRQILVKIPNTRSNEKVSGEISDVLKGGGFNLPPPRNSEGVPKSCQTQPDCENCSKLLNLGRQHLKMFGKKAVTF